MRRKNAIDKSDDSAQTHSPIFGASELGMTFEEEETIGNGRRFTLAIFRGIFLFYFEVQEKSADFSEPLFHKKGRNEKMHFSARALLVKRCLERPAFAQQ